MGKNDWQEWLAREGVMAEFNYLAIDAQGRRVRGRLSAVNATQAEQNLVSQGVAPIRLSSAWWLWRGFARRVPAKEMIAFTHQLGYLLKASVPLVDILSDMQSNAHLDYPRLTLVIRDLNQQLQSGQALSAVLSAYPDVFDAVYVGAVLAGEQSGQLDQAFITLYERLQWLDALEQRVRQLLTYPLLVLAVILLVTSILMTQLVPSLLLFLQDSGKPITGMTYALMVTSSWLVDYGALLLLIIVLAVLGWRLLVQNVYRVRHWRDKMRLQLGLLGRIQHYLAVMRVARVMALLYSAGLPFHPLLAISRQVAGNVYLADQFTQIEQAVMSGQSLTRAFEQTQVFPRMMIQLIRIGEQSGQLAQRLTDISSHYQHEVDRLLAQIEPWIEPIITLVLALLLGWVLMAIIMPIYEAVG